MAHFAVISGDREWLRNTEEIQKKIREFVEESGHSCSNWRPETATIPIDRFVQETLSIRRPTALIYMGHGGTGGWAYSHKKRYSYVTLAALISKLRKGVPTAVVNECCYSSSITEYVKKVEFDKTNLIVLTAGMAHRVSYVPETFEGSHVDRVLSAWFHNKAAFDPFEFNDNIRDCGEEGVEWEHWIREGPERFGTTDVDSHFFAR